MRRSTFTPVDLIISTFVVAMLSTGILIADEAADDASRRVTCAANLKLLGQVMLMYCNENKGQFPLARYDSKNTDNVKLFTKPKTKNPLAQDGPGPNDVTAALYLLMRGDEDIMQSKHFICPSTKDFPIRGKEREISNFPSPMNLSYSYANPYSSGEARKKGLKFTYAISPDFALMADLNPGGDAVINAKASDFPAMIAKGQEPVEGKPLSDEMKKANSPNHGGEGQNVLYVDGRVTWQTTPFCGAKREATPDNIFIRHLPADAPKDADRVMGPPMDLFDSVLLPTASSKPKDGEQLPPPDEDVDGL
jgi:hypothetical protein